MNRREDKERIANFLTTKNEYSIDISQDRPWTFVRIVLDINDLSLESVGFSKAHYPDKWDAQYGWKLALKKAVYKLAKEILNTPHLYGHILEAMDEQS